MAKKVYIAEFDANADPYLRKLKGIETKTATMSQKVEGSIGKINASYLKMAAGIAAVGTVTNYLTGIIKAYGEEEKAIKRLDIALGKQNRTLTQYASQLQKITAYADDQILEAMALIANYVKEEAMVKKLTKATMNLATAKGMDLSTAAELVAKTIGSSTNALSRYGIEIDNSKKGVDRINAVLEQFIIFQGQAEGEADTYAGKLQQMTNSFSDLEDSIAQGVLPTLNEFSTALTELSNKLGSSGISNILDKYLKLAFIVPRTGLSAINGIGNLLGLGSGGAYTSDVGTDLLSQLGIGLTPGSYAPGYTPPGKKGKGGPKSIPMIGTRKNDFPQRYLEAQMGYAGTRGGEVAGMNSGFGMMEMTEKAVPELKMEFETIGDSFVNKFSETQNIANQVGRIFNVNADSFVGKLMQAFDVGSSILSIVGSIMNIGSGGVTSLFGLAKGGTVINKHGQLSYAPIPKFARGGSFMVPPGYANDSGLMRVQSGERVDVTPSNQVPMLGKALGEIKSAIMAGNMNGMRKGKQPIVVNVMLDGTNVTKSNIRNQNRMSSAGQDFGDYN